MKKVYGVRSASWEPIAMVCESPDDAIEFACAMKGINPEQAANLIDNIVPLLFVEAASQTRFTGKIEPGGVSVLPCENYMSDDELAELEVL